MRVTGVVAVALMMAAPASAQQTKVGGATSPEAGTLPATSSAIEPAPGERADTLLKQMATYIASAREFTFHADILFDHVLPSGQKLQFAAAEDVALERPSRLYVDYRGDLGDRQFWYDGASVTLFDPATPFYATAPAPTKVDAMLETLIKDVDFSPPLADFLYSDPYESVRRNVPVRVLYRIGAGEHGNLPSPRLRRKRHRLADLDIGRAAAYPLQAGHHLQDVALAAAIQCSVHRMEFRAPHRRAGVHAGAASGHAEGSIRIRRYREREAESGRLTVLIGIMRKRHLGWLLTGSALACSLYIGVEDANAFFRGGFRGGGFGGFGGGGSRFGDGGFFDRSRDAGFGRGGFGNVHAASHFSDRADTYHDSHPEYQHNTGQPQPTHSEDHQSPSQSQSSRPEDRTSASGSPTRQPDNRQSPAQPPAARSDNRTTASQPQPARTDDRQASGQAQPARSGDGQTASQFQDSHPDARSTATQDKQDRSSQENELQQNRFNEANQLQSNRYNDARNLQSQHENNWNNYNNQWGGYYSGAGFGAGLAIGATMVALPAAAIAISAASHPYYYASGVFYEPQGGQYVVVPPPQGAVVPAPPPSCSSVYVNGVSNLDCGGAFYAPVAKGFQVIPPPIGSTVGTLPNGAVVENMKGTTYFTYGGAYYRPFYSGSSVIYEVVAKPG